VNTDQYDAFGGDKSVDEIQLEKAIEILYKNGYRVAKTAEEAKELAVQAGYSVTDPLVANEKVMTLGFTQLLLHETME